MSDIAAIVNCYTPGTGANRAQVVVRTGGSVEIHGEESLARHILKQLAAAQLVHPSAAPALLPLPKRGPGRPRKYPLKITVSTSVASAAPVPTLPISG